MIDDYTVAFVPGKDGLASADVRTKWFDAIARSSSLNVALQTPQWVQYRLRSADDLRLCVMRNSEKEIVGVTPLSKWTHGLPFYVKGRCLWSASLNATRVMGEIPLMPEEPQAYALFLDSLMREAGVNSIYMRVPLGTPFWSSLCELERKGETDWLFHRPARVYRYHCIRMPASFPEYLQQFSRKERQNMVRETNQLRAAGRGALELTRVTQSKDVPEFLANATRIAACSWQKILLGRPVNEPGARLEFLTGMAESNMLRAYCLHCGGAPCSYVIGFQINGVFHFHETAYDENWKAKNSPGKVLVYLLLQDLFAEERPTTVFFGYMDAWYKRYFGNSGGEEEELLLLRNSPSNRLKSSAHDFYRGLGSRTRRLRVFLGLTPKT